MTWLRGVAGERDLAQSWLRGIVQRSNSERGSVIYYCGHDVLKLHDNILSSDTVYDILSFALVYILYV